MKFDTKWASKWAKLAKHAHPKAQSLNSKPVYYQLAMFPYPSGRLHVGHLRVYTISDVLSRFKRMNGFHVIQPMGWDAFGLPAENAAILNKVDAKEWTYSHIDFMRDQVKRMLTTFDWDREVITCSSDYYKHTQQIFLWLFEAGLVYRKKSFVNWDPVDKTVLANEQIDKDGKSWRSGALVEQKELDQWFIKITNYAKTLQDDTDLLVNWPAKVISMQREWIKYEEGFNVQVKHTDGLVTTSELDIFIPESQSQSLKNAKFIVLDDNHELAIEATAKYGRSDDGWLNQVKLIYPNDHSKNISLPILVKSGEPIPRFGFPEDNIEDGQSWSKLAEELIVNDEFNLEGTIVKGEKVSSMHLHDWLISRQRSWGTPIPMVHCKSCGHVPVPSDMLPIELPEDRSIPLDKHEAWKKTTCPKCHQPAERETDTMDTFIDSSWYFLRYLDPHNKDLPFDSKVGLDMPVSCYLGGVEHAILHLLYARFIYKFLVDYGKLEIDSKSFNHNINGHSLTYEPFNRLITLGMVHGKTYVDPDGKYLTPQQAEGRQDLTITMEKMSKSKLNGIDPLEVIDKHGADTVRAHVLFQAPVDLTLDWDDSKIIGIERWLRKVESMVLSCTTINNPVSTDVCKEFPETYKKIATIFDHITNSLDGSLRLNTVISDYMKLTNIIGEIQNLEFKYIMCADLIRVIAPVCPAFAEEMFEKLGFQSSVHDEEWPKLEIIQNSDVYKVRVGKNVYSVSANENTDADSFLEMIKIPKDNVEDVIIRHDKKIVVIKLAKPKPAL